jgi:nucleotidyltransferase/DNA polymerase involved in DNA repair
MNYKVDFSSRHSRVIILLDLDFFYGERSERKELILGQVEQVRDPRLQGLPFVIKQKSIVATASYPARKLGIKKLQSYAEAKKLVPDLITIVGEVPTSILQWLIPGFNALSTCE